MSFSTKCHGAIDWEFSDSLPQFKCLSNIYICGQSFITCLLFC